LILAVAERSLAKAPRAAACRVHGGGFAGTVQAFVPSEYVETFRRDIDLVMGEGACMIMRVRPYGAIRVDE
jgi:galactokinase